MYFNFLKFVPLCCLSKSDPLILLTKTQRSQNWRKIHPMFGIFTLYVVNILIDIVNNKEKVKFEKILYYN